MELRLDHPLHFLEFQKEKLREMRDCRTSERKLPACAEVSLVFKISPFEDVGLDYLQGCVYAVSEPCTYYCAQEQEP